MRNMNGNINRKRLSAKIRNFKNEAAFLKFIRKQTEEDKREVCKLFPGNKYVMKYLDDRAREEKEARDNDVTGEIHVLSNKDYEKAEKDIQDLIKMSPLSTPFLVNIPENRFYEPRISFFNARPKMDEVNENDAKYLFRIINTHLTRKSSKLTKEDLQNKLNKITRKRGAKHRLAEADLRTNLAMHIWILARSKTMSKGEKNDLFIEALTHLSRALYMGGFSYFNVTSFGMMHSEYINNYKLLLEDKLSQILNHSQLYGFMPLMRNQLGGLELLKNASKFLNSRLINLFETHSLDFKLKKLYTSDFKRALSNYFKDKPDKMINGIHSKVFIFLYLDLLNYLSAIFQMDLTEMLTEHISLPMIMEKDYNIALRGHAIQIRQLLYKFYAALAKKETEPEMKNYSLAIIIEEKVEPTTHELLCKIMATCNQAMYAIRKKANIDRYIEVKYIELYPLYRSYDALVNYIPVADIDRDMKVFTINFLKDALFIKQQAIARQKEDRIVNVIQKMMDILKATYKRRVAEYKTSMIKSGEPDYQTAPEEGEEAEEAMVTE